MARSSQKKVTFGKDFTSETPVRKSKKACLRCKRRKTKCSGDDPCRSCIIAGVQCVYQEREKRVSVLMSSLEAMKNKISYLESELQNLRQNRNITKKNEEGDVNMSDNSKFVNSIDMDVESKEEQEEQEEEEEEEKGEEEKSHDIHLSRNTGLYTHMCENHLEAGSSDVVISKLAQIKNINVVEKENFENPLKQNIHRRRIYLSDDEIKKISLPFCERLIKNAHFYLSSTNMPYEEEEINMNLYKFFKTGYLKLPPISESYWGPLILIILALGLHYDGIRSDTIKSSDTVDQADNQVDRPVEKYPLFWEALSELFPFRNSYNEEIVAALLLSSYYFRSINEDNNAIMYSTMAMEISIQLELHKEPNRERYSEKKVENRRRIWWATFQANRFMCAKLGHPLYLDSSEISVSYPSMYYYEGTLKKLVEFPNSEDMKFVIELAKIAEEIVVVIYKKTKPVNKFATTEKKMDSETKLVSSVMEIIQRLINWSEYLPQSLKLDLDTTATSKGKSRRLKFSVHLNYCYQIHLASIAVLYQLFYGQTLSEENNFHLDMTKLSSNVITTLTICVNSAQLTTYIMLICYQETMIATFGMVDPDYIYSAALTLTLAKKLGFDDKAGIEYSLNNCLYILGELSRKGNSNASSKLSKIRSFIEGIENQEKSMKKKRKKENTLIDQSSENIIDNALEDSKKPSNSESDLIFDIDDFAIRLHSTSGSKNNFDDYTIMNPLNTKNFLPFQTDKNADIKLDILEENDVKFWENAYNNIHIWSQHSDQLDI